MATEDAVIVIAQAEGPVELAPAGDAQTTAHTETTGEQNLEHAETGMPQLDFGIYPNLIFWLILALIAVYFVLTRAAIPRISAVIAERNDAIANDLEEAALFKRRATEAEAAYNAALAKAREEAQKIGAETKVQINRELASLMAKADAEIAGKTAELEKRIGEIRDSAAQSVEAVARDTAAAIVQALVPSAADQAAVDSAIDKRLKG